MSLIKMIVGLGNPGPQYYHTRHNIGFLILEALANQLGSTSWDSHRSGADIARVRKANKSIFLVKPMSYMNKSGEPVQKILGYYKILPSNIIVIHDDMDLDFGHLKIAVSKGPGGHNGIKSIIEALGTKNFIRLRIGVGRPSDHRKDVTGHVLGKFTPSEQNLLNEIIENSVDACQMILNHDTNYAMNQINRR